MRRGFSRPFRGAAYTSHRSVGFGKGWIGLGCRPEMVIGIDKFQLAALEIKLDNE
jgi:hypothetical protein